MLFLAFGSATRKVIYTTNSIESLNYQLRKVTKSRGHFPNDAAAVKLLWLAVRNIARTNEPVSEPRKQAAKLALGKSFQLVPLSWWRSLGTVDRRQSGSTPPGCRRLTGARHNW